MVSPYRTTTRTRTSAVAPGLGESTPTDRAPGALDHDLETPGNGHSRTDSECVRALRPFGLSSREARMYLALARTGRTRARDATEGARLERATAYRVLARLVARGLVSEHPAYPREYSAIPLRMLIERNVAFLRDEIELRRWLVPVFPDGTEAAGIGGHDLRGERFPKGILPEIPDRGPCRASLIRYDAPTDSGLLGVVQGAHRSVDAVVRSIDIGPDLRSKMVGALVRAAMRGLMVRVVLDYQTTDRRLASALRRAPSGSNLEIRHYTPLGGHFYVLDGRTAVRFPLPRCFPDDSAPGLLSKDPAFVQSQITRFESVWEDAVPPATTRRDVRAKEFAPSRVSVPLAPASFHEDSVRGRPFVAAIGRTAYR